MPIYFELVDLLVTLLATLLLDGKPHKWHLIFFFFLLGRLGVSDLIKIYGYSSWIVAGYQNINTSSSLNLLCLSCVMWCDVVYYDVKMSVTPTLQKAGKERNKHETSKKNKKRDA